MPPPASTILLPFGIRIALDGSGSGSITSELRLALSTRDESATDGVFVRDWVNVVESLLLALACAGVNLDTSAAREAVLAAVDAIAQNLD